MLSLSEPGRVLFNRQELLGAKEDCCGRNWHVSGLVDWLGQQKTVNTGLVVFTDGIKLGRTCSPARMES